MRLAYRRFDILSRTGSHALKALSLLATLPTGVFADARDIAEQVGAPPNYLAKLLGQLGKSGFIEARKGAGGGFRLSRPAAELNLYELLEPVEQLVREGDCIMGGSVCDGSAPCALHARWAGIRAQMIDLLRSTSLDSLAAGNGTV